MLFGHAGFTFCHEALVVLEIRVRLELTPPAASDLGESRRTRQLA